ncbi:MAG TPA: energy-coupling factor transporter transmembrane component T [Candidatus Gastranaerophilales bacterium]|nr:energy-coupling factor transporter transmembrane component T [Candidatus Gastranaerophilales bacterium]
MNIIDIDYYAVYGKSWLNKIPVKIKLFALVISISIVVFSSNIYVLGALYWFLLAIILVSSVPKLKIIKISLFPLIFLLLFFVSFKYISTQTVLIFVFKALSASTSFTLLVFTTNYIKIFSALSVFLPDFIVNSLFLTYRSIFILGITLENLMNMLKLRGRPPLTSPVLFLKTLGNIIGFFVLKSIQTGENIYDSMKLRGYSDNFEFLKTEKEKVWKK